MPVCPSSVDARLPLVGEGVDVDAAGERFDGVGVAAGGRHPRLVLGWVGPAGHGHELDQRVAVAEGGLGVAHLGDRAAVALQAAVRQQGRIAAAAARQEGADRAVAELPQIVALPVAAQPVALLLVLEALQLQVGQLRGPFRQRRRGRAQGRQQPAALARIADPDIPDRGHGPVPDLRRQRRRLAGGADPGSEGGLP